MSDVQGVGPGDSPMSNVQRGGQGWGWRGLCSEVQCIMGNGHTGTPWEQTNRHE